MEEMDAISFIIKSNILSNRKMSILLISYTFMYFVIVVHPIFDFCVMHFSFYFLVALGEGSGNWCWLYLSQRFLSYLFEEIKLKTCLDYHYTTTLFLFHSFSLLWPVSGKPLPTVCIFFFHQKSSFSLNLKWIKLLLQLY